MILESGFHCHQKPIVVLSGGLDSTIIARYLAKIGKNPICLTFNYGQRHSVEIELAKKTAEALNCQYIELDLRILSGILANCCSLIGESKINVPKIQDILGLPQPNTYVPFRNQLFTTIALSIAESTGAKDVFLGIQCHDTYSYWDTSADFVKQLRVLAGLNREHQIEIRTPFISADKCEEILFAHNEQIPLTDTITCYNGKIPACGVCPSCAERIGNFRRAGFIDPIPYGITINWDNYKPYL